MKRHGGLWENLVSFENLHRAYLKARRGKRGAASVERFGFRLEQELTLLERTLRDGTWRPGPFRTFVIRDPKPRLISAAPFRDRVVHHALCNLLEPIFERSFISDSYACRKGKGTHAAVDRYAEFARQYKYVLKCDVRKFFPSVDHEILKGLLARKIKDRDVLRLAGVIIDHGSPQSSPHVPREGSRARERGGSLQDAPCASGLPHAEHEGHFLHEGHFQDRAQIFWDSRGRVCEISELAGGRLPSWQTRHPAHCEMSRPRPPSGNRSSAKPRPIARGLASI